MSHQPSVQPRPLDAVISDLEAAIDAWDCPKEQSQRETRYEVRSLKSMLQSLSVEVQFEIYQCRIYDTLVLQVRLFMYMIFYYIYFLFLVKGNE